MVAAARARGYAYCAITDHAPQLYMERMTTDKMLAQRRQLRDLERSAGITLLHGTELNIAPDGSLDWDDDFLAGFDVVVASVHSQLRQPRDQMTARLVRAISNPNVDIIGHPTTRLIGHRLPVDADLDQASRRPHTPARHWKSTASPTASTWTANSSAGRCTLACGSRSPPTRTPSRISVT